MDAFFETFDDAFATMVDINQPPQKIAQGCTWTEGPVWLNDTLYFNDIPAKRMMKWRLGQKASVALPNSEFANGNTLDGQGRIVSCEHGGRRVIRRLDPENPKAIEVIAYSYQGKS